MIIVFDARCLLCNGWVKFLLRHDRRGVFRFASIQGAAGQALLAQSGLRIEGLETMLLADGERRWTHTAAIIRVLHALGGAWRLAWIGWLVPSPWRDSAYRWVARRRYRLFGQTQACLLPPAEHAWRFLD